MFVRAAWERINIPKQDWEPRLIEVRKTDHHARTGAVIGLTSPGTDGRLGLRGLPSELQPRNRDTPDNLADEASPALALPRPEVLQGQSVRNFYMLKSDIARHGVAPGCPSVFVRVQRSQEAVEADDECRMSTFMDKNAPRRPAPEIAGGGGAAPVVALPTV